MDHLYKTDTNAVIRFYEEPSQNNFLSEKRGKPVYDTVIMAEIIVPGQSASTLCVEVERVLHEEFGLDGNGERQIIRSRYYEKYEAQVEAFKKDTGQHAIDGTPIRSWAQIDAGTAQTLIAQGIFTIEALASVSDSALTNIGLFARTLREQAKAYLTAREFGVPSAQMASELAELKEQVATLMAENAALKAGSDKVVDPSVTQVTKSEPTTPAPTVV